MKQFSTILRFELATYFKNKGFIIVTAAFVVIIALVLFSPRYMSFLFDDTDEGGNPFVSNEIIAIKADFSQSDDFVNYLKSALEITGNEVVVTEDDTDTLKTAIDKEEYDKVVVFNALDDYTLIVKNSNMYDYGSEVINGIVSEYNVTQKFIETGLTAQEVQNIMNTDLVKVEKVIQGKDQRNTFFYTYVMIMLLYFSVLMYGQFVTSSVVTEKTSRAMELLVTSAKPHNFIFGKVIGSGIAGLTQMSIIIGSALVFYNVNSEFWLGNQIMQASFDIPVEIFIYMLVFFICGFFMYAFLFAAVASLATKMEDLSSLQTPVMLCFIAAFFVTISGLGSGNVDTILIKVCSFIPLTSPMAMFTRIAMSEVPAYEIAISVGLLILAIAFTGWLGAKIYRIGVLMYGNKPSLIGAIKLITRR